MDFVKLKNSISVAVTKYKYVGIVLLAGIVLMMFPTKETTDTQTQPQEPLICTSEDSMEGRLEKILGYISGAGEVKVMLSVAQGERIIYQTDSTYAQGEHSTDSRTQTILITDSQRNQQGLIHQKNPPVYQGAIILAQGAADPSVKLAIVEAVSSITGLGSDKITVLKMQ